MPVVFQGTKRVPVHILGEPGQTMGRHAPKLIFFAMAVNKVGLLYMKGAMGAYGGRRKRFLGGHGF